MSGFIALLPNLVVSYNFWSGVVLGFQENTSDKTSYCFVSFDAIYNLLITSNLEFSNYEAAAVFKGETPTDFGFLIHLFEIWQEISLVFFNFYADCYVDLFL